MNTPTRDPLEQWLQTDPLDVPEDFTQRVMQRIAWLPLPEREARLLDWLQWLALALGAALGLEQLLTFMLGVWLWNSAA
jgi:hypothetical protein